MTQRMSSRAPQALANLYELMRLCPELQAVQVDYGLPAQVEQQHVCLTGNILDMAHEFAAQGALSRNEAFQLELLIWVGRPGDTQQESLERAFELLGVIDVEVLRPNVTLSRDPSEQGPVLWARITPQRTDAGALDEGWGTEIRCVVDCFARI